MGHNIVVGKLMLKIPIRLEHRYANFRNCVFAFAGDIAGEASMVMNREKERTLAPPIGHQTSCIEPTARRVAQVAKTPSELANALSFKKPEVSGCARVQLTSKPQPNPSVPGILRYSVASKLVSTSHLSKFH